MAPDFWQKWANVGPFTPNIRQMHRNHVVTLTTITLVVLFGSILQIQFTRAVQKVPPPQVLAIQFEMVDIVSRGRYEVV